VLGTRYFEFVFPEDLPGVLAFFADGGKGSHRFRAYGPTLAMYLEIHYEKISHGENWLVFATAVETQDRPAMLKAMLLSLPFIAITAKISAAAAAAAAAADLAA
jgi:hypothetical protein